MRHSWQIETALEIYILGLLNLEPLFSLQGDD